MFHPAPESTCRALATGSLLLLLLSAMPFGAEAEPRATSSTPVRASESAGPPFDRTEDRAPCADYAPERRPLSAAAAHTSRFI